MSDFAGFQGFIFPLLPEGHYKLLPRNLVGQRVNSIHEPGPWSELSLPAKALLPVITRHSNPGGQSWASEGRLAAEAGLCRKSVRKAARELERARCLTIAPRFGASFRGGKLYQVQPQRKGLLLPTEAVDCCCWRELTPSAKALYMSLRYFGRIRLDLEGMGSIAAVPKAHRGKFLLSREADYIVSRPGVLSSFAGIDRRSFSAAIESLEMNHLAEITKDGLIKLLIRLKRWNDIIAVNEKLGLEPYDDFAV
ncbi:MAG: helix-turn-helix domain-containing protein [Proteobacteria bacterium]|nr:helix-turn-helix domain-containing protein [Pseudomonadota bacterium]